MNYQIKNINNQNFKKFGDLISIKEKNYDEINKNTTKSFFDLANIQIEGEDKKSRLNIFEARYLKMTEDAMSSNRLIGMIQPKKLVN